MKFSIDDIRIQSVQQPFSFERTIDVNEVKEMNPDVIHISPVTINGQAVVDKDEFIFTFTMEGVVTLPCARTLVEVDVPFSYDADEVYSAKDHITAEELAEEVHPIEGYFIDLRPQIVEQIILQLPYRVFSDEEVLEDGNGWNYYSETDQSEQKELQRESIDPRLSKLKQLLNDDQEEK